MSIKVDYVVMENANTQMQQISRTIDEKLDTLRSGLARIHWEGADREAYRQHQDAWDRAILDINKILNEIGVAVGLARSNYLSTEMGNSRLWTG